MIIYIIVPSRPPNTAIEAQKLADKAWTKYAAKLQQAADIRWARLVAAGVT